MNETLSPDVADRTRAGILLGRFGRAEEVSGTLALLASKAGSFITGQTFLSMVGSRLPDPATFDDERLWPQFARRLDAAPQALALIDCEERAWTRADLARAADDFAVQLRDAGIDQGARVLVSALKSATTLAVALAVSKLEAVFCPCSPKLSPADVRVLEERLGHAARVETDGESVRILPLPSGPRSSDPRDGKAVLIGFTSGTTGVPKGVMHGAVALNYATRCCAHIAGLEADEDPQVADATHRAGVVRDFSGGVDDPSLEKAVRTHARPRTSGGLP